MRFAPIACVGFVLALIVPMHDANAQRRPSAGRGAVLGGMTGAAIGGIAGSGRGAAIGGLVGLGVGSVMGRQMESRRGGYYWYDGRCWFRLRNGEFHPVHRRYC